MLQLENILTSVMARVGGLPNLSHIGTNMSNPDYRKAERDAFCRSCDKSIKRGTDMISWYSHRNQGMNIHICLSCAESIGALAKNHTNILAGAEIHADKGYQESTLEKAETFAKKRNYNYD